MPLNWGITVGRRKQLVTVTKKLCFFGAVKRSNQPKTGVSVPMLVNNKERVIADTERAKLCEKTFFRGGNLNGKNLDENFLTETKCQVNVALGTARGNVEQESFSDACYMLSKRITLEELGRVIKKIDRNKSIDPYNWHTSLIENFKFFTLSLFLHLLSTCWEVRFWTFKQASVTLLKKPFRLSLHQFSIACRQFAGAHNEW